MRVLWFNHRDPLHPEAGGAEVRIHEIGKRLVADGCKVKLVCERWKGAKHSDFLDGIEIVRVAGKYGVHLRVPFMLNSVDHYDVVVDDVAHAVPWFSPFFARAPVIGQVHHVHHDALSLELNPFLARFAALAESSLRFLYKTLVVVSESTKRDLITRFRIPGEKIKVVPNGVDTTFYKPMKKNSQPTVLWVGRVKKYKRVDHVLKAYRLVKDKIPETRLVIAGDGDNLEASKKANDRFCLSDVVFTGKISEYEKVRLMASSWVIVSASLVEGWGMTIAEGAACGTPAVAYDVAGLRDSVCDGNTGFLVKNGSVEAFASAIIEILEYDQLRSELGKNSLEYAKRFSWEKSAAEFLKALELAMDGS